MKTTRKGISLIVLVITIIVMIILAAAIILSLDGSDIIERAKGAQSSNDVATAKEIVALAKSEWSFERQEGYDTFREYAESKLEEAGINMDNTYVEDSGKVLFDTAARFARAGVEIGTEVTGYTLNSTTSYITSGKENPTIASDGSETTTPQPATLKRDTNIKWVYVGEDEDGNALIAGSVTSTTPRVTLLGKAAYVYGPSVLDEACQVMYSSNKGTARSMKIEDVIRILEYTGETSGYFDQNYNYIPTKNAKTIGQIAKEIGYDITNFANKAPESGKDISTYKADYFEIDKTNDANEYNVEREKLIYPGTTSTNPTLTKEYWLSSPSIYARFGSNYAFITVRYVYSSSVNACYVADSNKIVFEASAYLRPVVVLASDVDVTYNGTVATLQ